ncbi:MAG: hypothetical protein M3N28_05835 [Actinomycetota bacterium]|nr:hypothetical protein [Actinomycetota bacterium]
MWKRTSKEGSKRWSKGRKDRSRPSTLWLCLLAVAALAAVACGGTGTQREGVASVTDGKGAASKTDEQRGGQRAKDPEKAMLDFARCMREHGVDMPDPKSGEGGTFRFEAPQGGMQAPDEPKFMEADKACRHLMGDAGSPQLSPEDQKQVQDAMLAFARCMRERGVEVPDPQPSGGIVAKVGQGVDPRSAEFQAAEKECRKHTEAIDQKLGVTRSEG